MLLRKDAGSWAGLASGREPSTPYLLTPSHLKIDEPLATQLACRTISLSLYLQFIKSNENRQTCLFEMRVRCERPPLLRTQVFLPHQLQIVVIAKQRPASGHHCHNLQAAGTVSEMGAWKTTGESNVTDGSCI
jgi:hypothetical protein